ncbi:MAG TPA: hypothetical protein PK858_03380, partial [Saprospiraceae bacterium]|nr:hypothetical protein [Saprospiraceae bacterium]
QDFFGLTKFQKRIRMLWPKFGSHVAKCANRQAQAGLSHFLKKKAATQTPSSEICAAANQANA